MLLKKQNGHIDLHIHSRYSDGSMTPKELVNAAANAELAAIALTDHDTTDGILEAQDAGWRYNIEIIPGIEMSTALPGSPAIHILGYYIDTKNSLLRETLANQSLGRKEVHQSYLVRLEQLGFPMTHDEVKAVAGIGQIGRAHYARVMQDKGYVSSVEEAFQKYLNFGQPAYLERETITPEMAVRVIKNAGGAAFLAHPLQLKMEEPDLIALIKQLKKAGLCGIEAYYSEHTFIQQERLKYIAQNEGLIVCGGSDFHAKMKPHIEIGSGINNNLIVPYSILKDIKACTKK